MLIREAEQSDFGELGDVRVAAYLADGFLSADSDYVPHLRALGSDGLGEVLVAAGDRDGRILGTVMLVGWPHGEILTGPGEAEIRALAVRRDARGAGIGKALVAAVIDRAAGRGVRYLVLSTQPGMKAAHRLYEQAGFTRLPERDWSPMPGVDLLAYRLVLDDGSPVRGGQEAAGRRVSGAASAGEQ